MEKLETFFIKTIVEAGELGLATSGVVSDGTSRISDFLISESAKEQILEKLVSSPISKRTLSKDISAEPVTKVEASAPEVDEQLLSKLTKQSEETESEPPVELEKVETKPIESEPEQAAGAESSILDELTKTDKTISEQVDEEQTDDSEGDITHA
jgi:hypothetical protein